MKNKNLIFIPIIILLMVAMIVIAIVSKNKSKLDITDKVNIAIDIKDYGVIKATLDPKVAPITVNHFVSLINEKYYDGLTFHRIIDGFMIQGGMNMEHPSTETIKGEFNSNGVKNNLKHTRGVISMARATDYNSASTQFFIVQKDSPHLDGLYASFGVVTEGMEIVDKIASDAKPIDSNGSIATEDRPIINSIRVVK